MTCRFTYQLYPNDSHCKDDAAPGGRHGSQDQCLAPRHRDLSIDRPSQAIPAVDFGFVRYGVWVQRGMPTPHPHLVMAYSFREQENMRTSVNNAALMHAANFSIAAHTDHPAVNGQFPMREASMMYNFGLPAEAALASLFSVPAKAMGFDHRIGYVREGMDADLVVWDDHPLQLGATPLQVWVDGEAQIEAGSGHAGSSAWDSAKVDAPVPKARGQVGRTVESSCQAGVVSFVVENVNSKLHPSGEGKDTMGRVVIRDGTIVCTGTCEDAARRVQTDGGFSMNMTDGFLLPVSPTSLIPSVQPVFASASRMLTDCRP